MTPRNQHRCGDGSTIVVTTTIVGNNHDTRTYAANPKPPTRLPRTALLRLSSPLILLNIIVFDKNWSPQTRASFEVLVSVKSPRHTSPRGVFVCIPRMFGRLQISGGTITGCRPRPLRIMKNIPVRQAYMLLFGSQACFFLHSRQPLSVTPDPLLT